MSTNVDRRSELWQRLRGNVGPTVDVDADQHADGVWLVTRAFENARNTTDPAGNPHGRERQPGQEGAV